MALDDRASVTQIDDIERPADRTGAQPAAAGCSTRRGCAVGDAEPARGDDDPTGAAIVNGLRAERGPEEPVVTDRFRARGADRAQDDALNQAEPDGPRMRSRTQEAGGLDRARRAAAGGGGDRRASSAR